MEKNINMIEEMTEEVKVEELDLETLDEVDGGKFGDANEVLCTAGIIIGAAGLCVGCLPAWAIGCGIAIIGL